MDDPQNLNNVLLVPGADADEAHTPSAGGETVDYDLIVVGAGSGNALFRPAMANWKIAVG